ncbi:hypothetical protein ACLMJK_006104 [Lecanora helva]
MSFSSFLNRLSPYIGNFDTSIPLLPLSHPKPSTPPSPLFLTAPSSPLPGHHWKMTTPTHLSQNDVLLTLSRQGTHLQNTLQELLDAQSEGLLAGLAGGAAPNHEEEDARSSRGGSKSRISTTTATTTSNSMTKSAVRKRDIVPVRQPPQRKPGLHTARRGIAHTITDLAAIKHAQSDALASELTSRNQTISTIDGYTHKTRGLQQQIQDINNEDGSRRVEILKREERELAGEIHALETRLYEMRARQRHLGREIEEVGSRVRSRLSSYESALKLAEEQARKFLERPPPLSGVGSSKSGSKGDGGKGVWDLPKERRTLEMAREFYVEEQEGLKGRLESVRTETVALEDGATVWEEVVQEVDGVEAALREEMHRMHSSPLLDSGQAGDAGAERGMKGILAIMQEARTRIGKHLDRAERENWRLLVCCIGAELEALTEGQAVLEGAMETAQNASHDEGRSIHTNGAPARENPLVDDGGGSMANPQDQDPPAQAFLDRSEDEDDGPGPELLISHHDEKSS